MAGPVVEDGVTYSGRIAFVYVFNLIVGAGALALPQAFGLSGWTLGIITITVLGLVSYCTSTFMVEAMSIANAAIRVKQNSLKKRLASEQIADVVASDSDEEEFRTRDDSPLLVNTEPTQRDDYDLYEITRKVEMGQMAKLFYNRAGLIAYYVVIALYLYGDLAIYAAAVPKSLVSTTCGANSTKKGHEHYLCFKHVTNINMYRIYLLAFTALLCPFAFFNLGKTKVLQLITTVLRWLAFILMIVLALIRVIKGHGAKQAQMFEFTEVPNFFGVAVYAFMCQHSLPSIITPVRNKQRIHLLLVGDFLLVLAFYVLLALTAVFAFNQQDLHDIYTLNFGYALPFFKYFLQLFPVFTLSTNFPIISITLRENLKTLFLKEDVPYGLFVRRFLFPLLTLCPPIIVAFVTADVEMLVSVTGSYAGAVIQYVIPVTLVFYGRLHMRRVLGSYVNKYRSPFRQRSWIFFIILWYFVCVIFVTVYHILKRK